ncbi:MAG: class I SAM-dependent methyltransferase [Clostridium sp.]|nr:class I SAM-dependent methyltransferase [Bacteroides sp.]MCM1198210.1 class I SAM-dependent methyltransferase [Clostridium sp.]
MNRISTGTATPMQSNSRYVNRERYFLELAQTSREYYIDYISRFKEIDNTASVLEIGCGEGGNLLPFAEKGCRVAGIDILPGKIENARLFFHAMEMSGEFYCADFLVEKPLDEKFDIILIHDVIEHIEPEHKDEFFIRMAEYLNPDGIVFFGFPAWQMPFGGHQQICRSRMSRIPFIHLLPEKIYRSYLIRFGENPLQIDELMGIKRSKMTPGRFRKLCKAHGYTIIERILWLVSPHYKAKFNLRPMKLFPPFGLIPYVRNYFSTSCFYVIKRS